MNRCAHRLGGSRSWHLGGLEIGMGRAAALAVLLLGALSGAGCASSASVHQVTAAIRTEVPGMDLERSVHVRIGPISMRLVRGLASLAGDELRDEERRMLAALRRVEVDVFEIRDRGCGSGDGCEAPRLVELERQLAGRGWSPVIMVREDDGMGMVLAQEDQEGRVRGMFVVSIEEDELVVVRIEGLLDDLLVEAIADEPESLIGMLGDEM